MTDSPPPPDPGAASTPATILCFGDSNTWGYIPGSAAERYPPAVRWPGVLAAALDPAAAGGRGARVVEEALNGRTTVWDDPWEVKDKNGKRHLPVALDSHAPIDLVLLLLGTNDLKHHLGLEAEDIALGAGTLLDIILESDAGPGKGAPGAVLVAPPPPVPSPNPFGHKFDGAVRRAAGLPAAYAEVAAEKGVPCFDAAAVAACTDTDGVHLDAGGHRALGEALAAFIRDHNLLRAAGGERPQDGRG